MYSPSPRSACPSFPTPSSMDNFIPSSPLNFIPSSPRRRGPITSCFYWIPACAGMTVVYSGMTVVHAGMTVIYME